jgi:hypothetical protein
MTGDILRTLTLFQQLTNSMEQSTSWKADSSSAKQEMPHMLQNLEVQYHIHKSLPPVPILHQINLVHASPSNILKISFNITLPSTPRTDKCCLSLRFPYQNTMQLFSPPYVPHALLTSFFLIWPPI